jgi:hypothetical protein
MGRASCACPPPISFCQKASPTLLCSPVAFGVRLGSAASRHPVPIWHHLPRASAAHRTARELAPRPVRPRSHCRTCAAACRAARGRALSSPQSLRPRTGPPGRIPRRQIPRPCGNGMSLASALERLAPWCARAGTRERARTAARRAAKDAARPDNRNAPRGRCMRGAMFAGGAEAPSPDLCSRRQARYVMGISAVGSPVRGAVCCCRRSWRPDTFVRERSRALRSSACVPRECTLRVDRPAHGLDRSQKVHIETYHCRKRANVQQTYLFQRSIYTLPQACSAYQLLGCFRVPGPVATKFHCRVCALRMHVGCLTVAAAAIRLCIYGGPETAHRCYLLRQPQTHSTDLMAPAVSMEGTTKALLAYVAVALSLIHAVTAADYVVGNPGGGWDGRTDYKSWAAAQTFAPGDTLSKPQLASWRLGIACLA